jgi:hypothetical protein
LAAEYRELKENPQFQKLILQGYLGKLPELEKRILQETARDEETKEVKREYQELKRFESYLKNLESGENAEFYKVLFMKMQDPTLTDEEKVKIQQEIVSRAAGGKRE